MKILIIIPYFGNFPKYFDLFLMSAKNNPSFDFLIITDNKNYKSSENVFFENQTFNGLKNKIQTFFDFEISIDRPHKLCDFKPSYGYVFKEFLDNYDYWGYCDVDVILGDLDKFYNKFILEGFDKIGSIGHFTLYKNTDSINSLFMAKYNDNLVYKEVFSSKKSYAFDEYHCSIGSINHIFDNSNYAVKNDNFALNFYYDKFQFIRTSETNLTPVIAQYKNGKTICIEISEKNIYTKEYPYIHLHKREMAFDSSVFDENNFYIVPNKFITLKDSIDYESFKKYIKRPLIDLQYFKIRKINLKYKLKNFF